MLTHYIPLALRTNSPVTGSNPEVSPNLLHAALGLASEVLEVLLANPADTLAELGDVCWFVALAGFELGCDPFADALEGHDFGEHVLLTATNTFVSGVKKAYAYGTPLEVQVLRATLRSIVLILSDLAYECGSDLETVQAANIAKLKARFPERFDTERAVQRDLDAEQAAVEGLL